MRRPRTRWTARPRPTGDEGVVLLLALLLVTVIALVTGAVLTRGDGSLRATVALRDAAGADYAADAAVQVALNDLRTGYNVGNAEPSRWFFTNAPGTGCFGYDTDGTARDTLVLDGLVPARAGQTQEPVSAAVVCTPERATGEQGSAVPVTNANKPGNAILTLGTSAAENGVTYKTNGGGVLRVRGSVFSNSSVAQEQNGVLKVSEAIRAHSCTPPPPSPYLVAPVINCAQQGFVADPGYPSDLGPDAVLTLRTPPATCPPSGRVELQPGYYDDVSALNQLTKGGGSSCFVHLNPGTYYLDFHNDEAGFTSAIAANSSDSNASSNTWAVDSGTVVGGTLTGATTIPGACESPIDSVTAQGVQIVLGGTSRIVVDKGAAMELCATYRSSRPPIVIYGQQTGAQTTVARTVAAGTPLLPSTAAYPDGGFSAASASDLAAAGDGRTTSWTRQGSPSSARVVLDGFAPSQPLPAGAVVTKAVLVVDHAEGTTAPAVSVALPGAGGPGTGPVVATANNSPTPTASTALHQDRVDLTALNGWSTFARGIHASGYTGARVTFTASPKNTGTVTTLDAVRLELTYYVPQLRAESGAVAAAGGLPVVQALGQSTLFYAQGTTYVPLARVDLALSNIAESVFRFGVIARSLRVFQTGSYGYLGPVIELPDNSPGFGFNTTLLQLKVYLCPGVTSGCSASTGRLALTARTQMTDDNGVPGQHRQVQVLAWSQQ